MEQNSISVYERTDTNKSISSVGRRYIEMATIDRLTLRQVKASETLQDGRNEENNTSNVRGEIYIFCSDAPKLLEHSLGRHCLGTLLSIRTLPSVFAKAVTQ